MVDQKKVYIGVLFALILAFGIGWIPWWNAKSFFPLFVPDREDEFAREFIDTLREGNYLEAERRLSPDLSGSEALGKLKIIAGLIDQTDLVATEIISSNLMKSDRGKRNALSYQLLFPETFMIVNVAVDRINDRLLISGINIEPIPRPIQEINAFTISDKPFANFIILACSVFIPFLIIFTLFICVRSEATHKWLWMIFILFGFCRLQLNWTTNEIEFNLFSIHLFGAAFFRPGLYGPWHFSLSIPLGAKVFLVKYYWAKKRFVSAQKDNSVEKTNNG